MKIALALAVALGIPGMALAQTTAFTYQGRLNDGPTPANGSYDLTFALFDTASGGTQQGNALTNSAVTVSNGLLTVTLDFGAGVFTGPDRWLEVGVRTNGNGTFSMLTPRQPITAMPYAIQAANVASNAISAASIQNATITGGKLADGQVMRSLNGLRDHVSVVNGGGLTITPNPFDNTLTLSAPTLAGTWLAGGNSGVGMPTDTLLGPTNFAQSLSLQVNASRALRLEHNGANGEVVSPNIFGGYYQNGVNGVLGHGQFIGGGGEAGKPNTVAWDHATVGGGLGNFAGLKSFVGGGENNRAEPGMNTVAGGLGNRAEGGQAFVGAGSGNQATGNFSAVSGGESNVVTSAHGFLGSGRMNTNAGANAVLGGGELNLVSGTLATVAGGGQNQATATGASVSGGLGNTASGIGSAVLGGSGNHASGYLASTLAGDVNTASGWFATTLGGYGNEAAGESSLAAGYFAHATQPRSFVFSTFNNGLTSSVPNEVLFGADRFTFRPAGTFAFDNDSVFRVGGKAQVAGALRAESFLGDASALSGTISNALNAQSAASSTYATNAGTADRITGQGNVQSGAFNFIGAGQYNTNTADYAAVVGGGNNAATGMYGFVGGGQSGSASGFFSAVLGGSANRASSFEAAAIGGNGNVASGQGSVALGGSGNIASGIGSAALGGGGNVASGSSSVAIGSGAHAVTAESFVWSSYNFGVTSTAPRQVVFAADEFVYRPSPFTTYSFYGSGFNIGGNAQVTGDLRANRFIGDGSLLSNIVSTTALTANYATSAGSAGSASSANYATLAGTAQSASNLLGNVTDAQLPAGLARLPGTNTFTGSNTFAGALALRDGINPFSTTVRTTNTADRLLTFPDATGTMISSGNLTDISAVGTIGSGTWNGSLIAPAYGGLGLNTAGAPAGSLLYASAPGTWSTLPSGTNGQVLKIAGGMPAWGTDNVGAGGVTSITAGSGLTGGTITSSGTIAVDATVIPQLGAANRFNGSNVFAGVVQLTNANNLITGAHSGDGSGLTALNAAQLTGTVPSGALSNAWKLGGNAGTTAGTHFVGTTDNTPLEFKANAVRTLRLEPNFISPNVIGGAPDNLVSNAYYGGFIGGGGTAGGPNRVGGFYSSVLGGYANTVSGSYASVLGGYGNTASVSYASVLGGYGNTASGSYASVLGGSGNTASGDFSVAMGLGTTARGLYSTAMGRYTTAANDDATAMGLGCTASGWDTVAMGTYSVASGHYAVAAGYYSTASNQAAFVWSDSSNFPGANSTVDNSVTMRASGGYRFFSNPSMTAGVSLAANGTAWSVISDRNVKKDIAPVDHVEILEKLAALPITQWRYQWESEADTPHIGPMAQDFKGAFYPGSDDKSITTQEADGVALAAIQGLNQKLTEELKRRDAENAALKARLERLEQLLESQLIGGAK